MHGRSAHGRGDRLAPQLALRLDAHAGPGAANPHVINGLMLFVAPACVVVLLLILRAVRFSSPSEPAEVESWHRWGSSIVVPYCLIALRSRPS